MALSQKQIEELNAAAIKPNKTATDLANLEYAANTFGYGSLENLGNEDTFSSTFRIKNKNNEYIWISSSGLSVKDDNGKIIRMVGAIKDESFVAEASKEISTLLEQGVKIKDKIHQFVSEEIG